MTISLLTIAFAVASAHNSEEPKSAQASAKGASNTETSEDTSTL